ncbi:cbb3-type cytochrome oxidase assembly protein CcoS [Reichenbachiella agarivorans]|uniref:Cbb3-type cytochrome oxidase assembly protein CcoS n=1 Tax=Reichenbachiella agarivorans TaxID=2979464 RepID=A0ABY6CM07_9BACT|nr:cbb3-type cytochrome oxidase assembly protein CcoS [Reichenbachiella agarivorans]UXP31429.1 cbb3-type cytochrome oxidase assembly protein CcoS [Reichenbachiella agarivorans]
MTIIIALILISLLVALIFLWLFVWSVRSGQYDDTDSPAVRILMDDIKRPKKKD